MVRWLLALLLLLAGVPGVLAQESKSFADQGFGYTLSYPGTWALDRPGAYTLLLRPPPEIAGGPVAVSVENVHQAEDGGVMAGIDTLVNRYLSEMGNAATQVEIHRQAPFRWTVGDGAPLVGQQVVADFTRDGLPYRQWAVFLPSPLGPVAHVWLFTAPQSLFAEWRPTAEDILRSLRPVTPQAK